MKVIFFCRGQVFSIFTFLRRLDFGGGRLGPRVVSSVRAVISIIRGGNDTTGYILPPWTPFRDTTTTGCSLLPHDQWMEKKTNRLQTTTNNK